MQHLQVSAARWRHYPGIARLSLRGAASPPSLVLSPRRWSPLLAASASMLPTAAPMLRSGIHTFVLEEHRRAGRRTFVTGLAQTRNRREPDQWDLVHFCVLGGSEDAGSSDELGDHDGRGPHPGNGSSAPVTATRPGRRALRLLSGVCAAGAESGVLRLFARVPAGPEYDDRYELFRQVGFVKLISEYTYHRDSLPDVQAPEVPGLRAQHRSDAFGVLQLYQAGTPPAVQLAEGLGSQSWDLPAAGVRERVMGQCRIRRWVVERDGRIVAWLQLAVQSTSPHSARLMVHPLAQDLTRPLLDRALSILAAYPANGVQFRVREHQCGLVSALESQGFRPVRGQLLLVKLMAVRVPAPQFIPALEKVV